MLRHQRCDRFPALSHWILYLIVFMCTTLKTCLLIFFKFIRNNHGCQSLHVNCTWTGSLLKCFLTCTFPIHKPDKVLEDALEHCCVQWHGFLSRQTQWHQQHSSGTEGIRKTFFSWLHRLQSCRNICPAKHIVESSISSFVFQKLCAPSPSMPVFESP